MMSGWTEELGVSRETLDALDHFVELLRKWNPTINLISKMSVEQIWDRHVWDSAQVYKLAPGGGKWVDMGSGGGFPGLIIAIMSRQFDPGRRVVLMESDMRKATFLRTVARELELQVEVVAQRIEDAPPGGADLVSARALSHLSQLIPLAQRHMKADGTAFFLKGESWMKEVEEAQKMWSFSFIAHRSRTNPDAAVLEVKEMQSA